MAEVVLKGVTHRYEREDVLKQVDLTIPHGSLFTLLGPSGCGKTTLLRVLAGFIVPTEGRVIIGGQDVTDLPCEKRNMGVVFQNYALFPNMTVRENIAYGLKVRRLPRAQAQERCERYIELAGLGDYVDRHVQELSGGQQQRVAVARALAIEPQMLLLDEPMSNLDVALRVKMREEIRSIQQQTGITTLFITHDQHEALSISDYVAVMREGSVLQVGTPEDIYNRPADDFVANFVGTTNAIDGLQLRPEQLSLVKMGHDRGAGQASLADQAAPMDRSAQSDGARQEGIPVRVTQVRFTGSFYEYTVEDVRTSACYHVLERNSGQGCAWAPGETCLLVGGTDVPLHDASGPASTMLDAPAIPNDTPAAPAAPVAPDAPAASGPAPAASDALGLAPAPAAPEAPDAPDVPDAPAAPGPASTALDTPRG